MPIPYYSILLHSVSRSDVRNFRRIDSATILSPLMSVTSIKNENLSIFSPCFSLSRFRYVSLSTDDALSLTDLFTLIRSFFTLQGANAGLESTSWNLSGYILPKPSNNRHGKDGIQTLANSIRQLASSNWKLVDHFSQGHTEKSLRVLGF